MKLFEIVQNYIMPYFSNVTSNPIISGYELLVEVRDNNRYSSIIGKNHIPNENDVYRISLFNDGFLVKVIVDAKGSAEKPKFSSRTLDGSYYGEYVLSVFQNIIRLERISEFKLNVEIERDSV